MTDLTRRVPFTDMLSLRDAVNQLVEQSFVQPARLLNSTPSVPLNLIETEDTFMIEAALPGVKPEDLSITLQENVLTIVAETQQEQKANDHGTTYRLMERHYGRFSRSITLPTAVNADNVQTAYEDGILRLVIAKAETAKPHKITVNTSRTRLLSGQTNQQAQSRVHGQ